MYSLHSEVSWRLAMCPLYRGVRYPESPLMEVPLHVLGKLVCIARPILFYATSEV